MANGIIYGKTERVDITARLVWSSKADILTGTSEVTVTLSYRSISADYHEGNGHFMINNVGKSCYLILGGGWQKVFTAVFTVAHDENGEASLSLGASGGLRYEEQTIFSETDCKGVAVLDKIPAASSPGSVPDTLIGRSVPVTWVPQAETFTYRLHFSLGEWQGASALICPNTTAPYTDTSFVIPYEAATALTDRTAGEMTVTLSTFRDGAGSILAGEHAAVFTVTVPQDDVTMPSFAVSFSPQNPSSDFDGLWIQGVTGVRAEISDVRAMLGAKIRSVVLRVDGVDYMTPYLSDALVCDGEVTLRAIVTDSRGMAREIAHTVSVIPYAAPILRSAEGESEIVCARCDGEGRLCADGLFLRLRFVGRCHSVAVDGVEKNSLRFYLSYREGGESVFSERREVGGDDILEGIVSSVRKSYTIRLEAVDSLGSVGTVLVTVPTDIVALHLGRGGNKAAFGKYAETENCLEIDPSWDVRGRVVGLGACTFVLGEEADLNDCVAPGTYAVSDRAAQSLENAPFAKAGRVTVSYADGTDGRLLQEYVDITGRFRGLRLVCGEERGAWFVMSDSGWHAAGDGVDWRKIDGVCLLRFAIVLSEDELALPLDVTLPEEVRPVAMRYGICPFGGGIAVIGVAPNGKITVDHIYGSSADPVYLEGYAEYRMN